MCDCVHCPIGLALREQLQLAPTIDHSTLEQLFDDLLPQSALDWMLLFDRGNTMQPFDFELDDTALELPDD